MLPFDLSQIPRTAQLDLCRTFFLAMDAAMQTPTGRAIIERKEAEILAAKLKGGEPQ